MIATTGFALSTGVAGSGPFCYETGPGYEKCLTSPSGDYFNPIYQGPKLDRPYTPSFPIFSPPPPVSIPAPLPSNTGNGFGPGAPARCPEGMYVDPNNLSSCLAATPGNDYVALAASPGLPTAGAAYGGAASQGEADRIAMAQCVAGTNSTCEIIARAYHACAAIALAPNGSMVSGVGPDPNAAATAAMNAAPGGQALGGRCSEPPGN